VPPVVYDSHRLNPTRFINDDLHTMSIVLLLITLFIILFGARHLPTRWSISARA